MATCGLWLKRRRRAGVMCAIDMINFSVDGERTPYVGGNRVICIFDWTVDFQMKREVYVACCSRSDLSKKMLLRKCFDHRALLGCCYGLACRS